MSALPPGSVIGMLGGGQLGRMLALAAAKLGFDVHVFDPAPDSPAARVSAAATVADWDDADALRRFAAACDVVTYEFENVPLEAVSVLRDAGANVRPGVKSLEKAQDRLIEKRFLNALGISTAPYEPVSTLDDLRRAAGTLGGKGILKRRRDGYDGKGQARLQTTGDVDTAWREVGGGDCILEALCAFECEISIVGARSAEGTFIPFDASRNDHAGGILRAARVPANISADTIKTAQEAAEALASALDHVGVLALEFFVMPDGRLLANEYAPRVHNSGHWTPEACLTGQFEQHIRAIAGWPLGPATRVFDVEMINLLGEDGVRLPGHWGADASIWSYGKRGAADGRKMGHVVVRGQRSSGVPQPD